MNTDRIKEIQQETAYPESVSVQQALLKVWNETKQEQLRINAVMRMMAVSFIKWLRDNTVTDGEPKLLLRLDMKRYTIEELYDLYTLIAE